VYWEEEGVEDEPLEGAGRNDQAEDGSLYKSRREGGEVIAWMSVVNTWWRLKAAPRGLGCHFRRLSLVVRFIELYSVIAGRLHARDISGVKLFTIDALALIDSLVYSFTTRRVSSPRFLHSSVITECQTYINS
jgi:hypothetical protein